VADAKRNVGSRTWKTKKDRSQKRHAAVNDSSGGVESVLSRCRFASFLMQREDILDPRDSNLTSDIDSAN
jgi:hypothetical protein